jgi:preprotein translocase subunit SecB
MDSNNEDTTSSLNLPIALIPHVVQLQNIVPIDITAKRFPVEVVPTATVNFRISISGLSIDSEHQQAQVIIETDVAPTSEPKFFEIKLQVVGLFTYTQGYEPNEIEQFLRSGSISALMPFIREFVFHLSTRLQVPPIMLPLIQLAETPNPEQPE